MLGNYAEPWSAATALPNSVVRLRKTNLFDFSQSNFAEDLQAQSKEEDACVYSVVKSLRV